MRHGSAVRKVMQGRVLTLGKTYTKCTAAETTLHREALPLIAD